MKKVNDEEDWSETTEEVEGRNRDQFWGDRLSLVRIWERRVEGQRGGACACKLLSLVRASLSCVGRKVGWHYWKEIVHVHWHRKRQLWSTLEIGDSVGIPHMVRVSRWWTWKSGDHESFAWFVKLTVVGSKLSSRFNKSVDKPFRDLVADLDSWEGHLHRVVDRFESMTQIILLVLLAVHVQNDAASCYVSCGGRRVESSQIVDLQIDEIERYLVRLYLPCRNLANGILSLQYSGSSFPRFLMLDIVTWNEWLGCTVNYKSYQTESLKARPVFKFFGFILLALVEMC